MQNKEKNKTRKTVLIVTRDAESKGGVSNYFRVFFKKYHDDLIKVQRFDIGTRARDDFIGANKSLRYLKQYFKDILRLVVLFRNDPGIKIVHVNPSFRPIPLIRDGIIIVLAKAARKKFVVFFRGWRESIVDTVEHNPIWRFLFLSTYRKADRIVVLANQFRKSLLRLGFPSGCISVSKTMFDGELVSTYRREGNKKVNFLFLGRIVENKGIFEIVEAASILKAQGFCFNMTFIGYSRDIDTENRLKNKAKRLDVLDLCRFKGYIDGKQKFKEFSSSDVYLFPSWDEGCPNSVLEAMASGVFVIYTDVGALREIMRDHLNGRVVRKQDPEDLADKMKWAINNIRLARNMGKKNIDYAFKHFESLIIVNQIKSIYRELLSNPPFK